MISFRCSSIIWLYLSTSGSGEGFPLIPIAFLRPTTSIELMLNWTNKYSHLCPCHSFCSGPWGDCPLGFSVLIWGEFYTPQFPKSNFSRGFTSLLFLLWIFPLLSIKNLTSPLVCLLDEVQRRRASLFLDRTLLGGSPFDGL